MPKFKNWPLLITGALAVLGLLIFCWFVRWGTLTHCFKLVKVADLPGTLAPLAFAAAVIERAVEILISPWRHEGASKLQKALAAVKARPANPATSVGDAADLKVHPMHWTHIRETPSVVPLLFRLSYRPW